MTVFGKNMKWTVDRAYRDRVRALFLEGLGASQPEGGPPHVELYRLSDGFQIGIFLVDEAEAPRAEDLKKQPWLEFIVEDVEATAAKLAELGIEEVSYFDKAHHYYAAPGGPVFRLAKAG